MNMNGFAEPASAYRRRQLPVRKASQYRFGPDQRIAAGLVYIGEQRSGSCLGADVHLHPDTKAFALRQHITAPHAGWAEQY
jgi:hypothetical protein